MALKALQDLSDVLVLLWPGGHKRALSSVIAAHAGIHHTCHPQLQKAFYVHYLKESCAYRKLKVVGALGPITVAIVSITLTWAGHLRSRVGIKAVGHIDAGLPPFTVWHPPFMKPANMHGPLHEHHCLPCMAILPVHTCMTPAQQPTCHIPGQNVAN